MSKSLKNISVVAGATMASRVLGLVREMLTAAVFGTSAWASAFATAFLLPNTFRRLLAEGGMTAAFIPTLNDEVEKRRREGAFVFVSQMTTWLTLVCAAVSGAAMLLLSQRDLIVVAGERFGADAATISRWLLAAKLGTVLFPYLIFVCLAAVFSAALQTFNRFLEPALSPIWLNVAMIAALLLGLQMAEGTEETKMVWFCGGVLLGGFLQMAVPAYALTREGWKPRLDLTRSEGVKAVARLMAPTILGSSVYLINMVVSRFLGLTLNDAAVSVLNYATRLMELPIGVFAVAVSTVVFPLISRHASQGDFAGMGVAYRKGMRLILLINVPAAAGLALLADPIIRLLFQHGAFQADDTQAMVPILIVFAVGLPFFSFVNLILRAFYAFKDTLTPVVAAVFSFVVNIALSLLLMERYSTVGLAVASNVAVVVQAVYLQWRLTQRGPQFGFLHLGPDLLKIVAAMAGMSCFVGVSWRLWSAHLGRSLVLDAAGVAVGIGLGVAVYGVLVFALKIEGRDEFVRMAEKFGAKMGLRSGPASPR